MRSSRSKIAIALGALTVALAPTGALATSQPKPGATEVTLMDDPIGAGALNERAMALNAVIGKWNEANRDALGDFYVSAMDLSVNVHVVGRDLTKQQRQSLLEAATAAEPQATLVSRVVDISRKDLKAILDHARADLPGMRRMFGATSVNFNNDSTALIITTKERDRKPLEAWAERYGPHVSVEAETFRLNSEG